MKINSLYISAFGGLKNLKLDLQNGLNIIYGENENGKTTVMAFIKMMFYGSERGSSLISKNIRKKYTPWDGSAMGGSIDFTANGKDYRIEREFRSSNSTDKVTLCDLALGTRQSVGADIGKQFFGISASAFERSIFIGQFGFPESDSVAEGEINSKLSNIALSGDEQISFEAVNSRLEKAKTALMSKSGRTGIYDKNLKNCNELKARIEKAYGVQKEYDTARAKISALEAELGEMIKSASELKEKISTEQDVRNAEKLKNLLELKSELDTLNASLTLSDGKILDEMFLRKLKFSISKVDAAKQRLSAKEAEKETLKRSISAGLNPSEDATQENADRLKAEIAELESNKLKTNKLCKSYENQINDSKNEIKNKSALSCFAFLGVGVVLSIVAVVLLILKLYLPCALTFAVGIILIGICPVLLSKRKKEMLQKEKAQNEIVLKIKECQEKETKISEEIFAKKVKLETITASLNSSASIIANQQKLLAEIETESVSLNEELLAEEQSLLKVFSLYKNAENAQAVISALDEISEKTEKQKEIKQKINFLLKDLGGISYEEAAEKLKTISPEKADSSVNFEFLKEKYDKLVTDIGDRKSTIAALSAQANSGKDAAATAQKLTEELKNLISVTKDQKEFCIASEIAMQTLLESFAEIRKSYGSVLEKRATEIFKSLTGKKYETMSVSKEFEITVQEKDNFGSREIDFLSSGTADQAYLSLRLALSSLICDEKEHLPILLDDALAQYDDMRMKTALNFLNEYAKNAQVIMFTCHTNISKAAETFESNNISLIR